MSLASQTASAVTLRLDFADTSAELAALPRATLDGVAGKPAPSHPGSQAWTFDASIAAGADFELSDPSDAWWITVAAPVERRVTLSLPIAETDDRDGYAAGDEVVAEVTPAPSPEEIAWVFGHFTVGPRLFVDLDDVLLFDPDRGEIAGIVPPLPDGAEPAGGELTVGLAVVRPVECEGPAVCDIDARDMFRERREVDLIR